MAGLTFAVLEVVIAAALLALVGPQRVSAMLVIAGAVTAGAIVAVRPLLVPPGGGPDEPGGGSPSEPEPPWWPDFERDFREWDARRSGPLAGAGR